MKSRGAPLAWQPPLVSCLCSFRALCDVERTQSRRRGTSSMSRGRSSLVCEGSGRRSPRWARQRGAEAKGEEEEVAVGRGDEKRVRRKLCCIVWRQWKNPRTRFHKLLQYGANRERAARAAWNGRGPWWNAGASHMNLVIPNGMLRQLGLISLLDEWERFVNLV